MVDPIFFKWLTYMFEKAKGIKICKTIVTILFGAWGFLLFHEKSVFSQPVPCKKNAVKFVIFFFQQIINNFCFMNSDCF